jgi:hypothetical protein
VEGYSPYYSEIIGYSDPYDLSSAITHTEIYNFPNKIYFLENTAIKDSSPEHKNAFTQRTVIPINDQNISPLSLIISSTDTNQLNTYKSGIYIHDPI